MKLLVTSVLSAMTLAALAFAQDRGRGAAHPGPGADKPAKSGDKPSKPGDKAPKAGDKPSKGGDQGRDATRPTSADQDDLAQDYFTTSDYDGSGWISFNEAHAALNLDRKAFAVYDTDNDGRISADEFATRYRALKAHGGVFPAPLPNMDVHQVPKRGPQELITAFDGDRDGALDEHEIARALDEYGAHGVDAPRILSSVDRDASKKVEANEAQALLDLLAPPSAADSRTPKAASIAELFDKVEPRRTDRDLTPQPGRIVGPVTTFRRLDYDQSGGISVEDLEALQRPLQLPVRIRAVLAVLDTNHDGELSPQELDAALK